MKILWLNENAVTPYDATIDYPTNAVTIKDGAFKIFNGSVWNIFLTKSSVGLGNVDNTSDLNKPISISTQAALNNKASVSSVESLQTSIDLKADLDVVKRGIGNIYDPTLTYNENERVILLNGDVVKSTVSNNTNNPNTDMTGWSIGLPAYWVCTATGTGNAQFAPCGIIGNGLVAEGVLLTEIQSATSNINTIGKTTGKIIYNRTDSKLYTSTGITAVAAWRTVDGSSTITPS